MDNLNNLCRFCLRSGAINPLESVLHFIQHFSKSFDVSTEKNQYTVERKFCNYVKEFINLQCDG
jgi:hypothetical protein